MPAGAVGGSAVPLAEQFDQVDRTSDDEGFVSRTLVSLSLPIPCTPHLFPQSMHQIWTVLQHDGPDHLGLCLNGPYGTKWP